MHIALGVARGLSFLHEGCSLQIIQCDINPSNILLDKNFKTLTGDFGFAKFTCREDLNQQFQKSKGAGEPHQMTEAVMERSELWSCFQCGTYGYTPLEYVMRWEFLAKNDVFAFGMVLLEFISGVKPSDLLWYQATCRFYEFEQMTYFLEHIELGGLIDPSSRRDYDEYEAKKLDKLALLCLLDSPTERPTMSEVVQVLNGSYLDERWESEKEEIVVDIWQTSSQSRSTLTDLILIQWSY